MLSLIQVIVTSTCTVAVELSETVIEWKNSTAVNAGQKHYTYLVSYTYSLHAKNTLTQFYCATNWDDIKLKSTLKLTNIAWCMVECIYDKK